MATAPSFFADERGDPAPSIRAGYDVVTHVRVDDLGVSARVGINPDEQGRRQPLLVSVDLELAEAKPAGSLRDSVDYRRIAAEAEGLASDHVELIETFALLLGERCLRLGPVERAEIIVAKPEALLRGTASVRIVLRRRDRRDGR